MDASSSCGAVVFLNSQLHSAPLSSSSRMASIARLDSGVDFAL
jgi:hypothetical protein